jgi:hypothetical protein
MTAVGPLLSGPVNRASSVTYATEDAPTSTNPGFIGQRRSDAMRD